MTAKPRILLATGNQGKIREMRAILGDRFEVLIPADLHLKPLPEGYFFTVEHGGDAEH